MAAAISLWGWSAAAVAAAALTYLPSLRNGFVWDDPLVLEQLRAIHSVRDLFLPPEIIPRFYYRPLVFVTYLIDRVIGGEQPLWFHVSVVATHVLNTGLLCWLGVRLFGPNPSVALTALLFATHPIHVESVAWMAGRSDVLAASFMLLSATLLTYDERPWAGWAAVGSYALALISKEVAIAGVVLFPFIDLVRRRPLRWSITSGLLAVTFLYLAMRHAALGATITGTPGTAPILATALAAVGFYASKLLVPIGLSAYVPELPSGALLPAWGLITITAATMAVVVTAPRGDRITPWLIAWFFATLAPSLVVIARQVAQTPVADRYLYVPSLAVSLLLCRALTSLRLSIRWERGVQTALLALSVLLAIASVTRNRVWAADLVFWQDVTAKAPGYAFGHRELAQMYLRRNQLDEAEAALKRALAAKSEPEGRVMTLNNLGNLYLRRQQLDQAEQMFREGLTIREHEYLHNGLGRLAMRRAELAQARGDTAEAQRQVRIAREQLERCTVLAPNEPKGHALLGQVLYTLNDRAGARQHLQLALQLGAEGSVADATRHYLKMLGP
ncbi:MAG TPA: tetratricopeptide repeat protein [Candidatus Kryptonia bacterium]|nr:tetratricopeptide repeat protein [Candidatus Kryptonia bacterium]